MLSQGKGNIILVGTTRNQILQGTIDLEFSPIIQVIIHVTSLSSLLSNRFHEELEFVLNFLGSRRRTLGFGNASKPKPVCYMRI